MTQVMQFYLKRTFKSLTLFKKVPFPVDNSRTLYSASALGIEKFLEFRENSRKQLADIAPKFKEKMKQFSEEESKTMIFTEDLKNMIYLTENEEDVQLVTKMMKKFNQQNKELRFGNFIFGTVVMRMFHVLNKPDEAVQCFRSKELENFFDQLMSYQILFDILYENKKYEEILELFKVILEKQVQGIKYPKNVVVLVMAACYKLNTVEALEYAQKLWKELKDIGHQPMRRAITFFAALALNHGKPEEVMEILSTCANQNYTTVRNLKISALCDLGRLEDCLQILKNILNIDVPTENVKTQTINKDVIEKLKKAIEKNGNQELIAEMAKVENYLQAEGHISDKTLDEMLCSPIAAPQPFNKGGKFIERPQFNSRTFQRPTTRRSVGGLSRPGLSDIA